MFVVRDGLAAEVAHLGTAFACHLVAAVRLVEGLLAAIAVPDQGLRSR